MAIDPWLALAGAGVGLIVGMTGLGGGALMTPLLVLVFRVPPLTAVSSDLAAAFVMKPVGGGVHLRRGTVDLRLVGWLCLGSVPAAFAGALALNTLGAERASDVLTPLLGVALLLAVVGMLAREAAGRRAAASGTLRVHPVRTVLIGAAGGLVVGLTSVGSGSLMMVALLWTYPRLSSRELVGADLVQAIPLVGAAALGHAIFGDLQLALTASLLLGAVPGVYLGARLSASARASDQWLRPLLAVVLVVSAAKLFGADTAELAIAVVLAAGAVPTGFWLARKRAARRVALQPA